MHVLHACSRRTLVVSGAQGRRAAKSHGQLIVAFDVPQRPNARAAHSLLNYETNGDAAVPSDFGDRFPASRSSIYLHLRHVHNFYLRVRIHAKLASLI